MIRPRKRVRWCAAAAFGVALSIHGAARADERDACATASEQAQALKLSGKLVEAAEKLPICSRAVCPKVVKHDCEQWTSELERDLPTVVIDARDADGRDLTGVRVTVDDVVVAESLDGKAIALNPGPHAIRYETAGAAPVSENVLVREGQKARILTVRFATTAPPQGATPSPAAESASPKPTADGGRSIPTSVYVLAGIGVVAIGAFTILALTGQSRFDDCAASHACSSSTKSSLGAERTVAWSALGVGAVSLGAAGWLFWTF